MLVVAQYSLVTASSGNNDQTRAYDRDTAQVGTIQPKDSMISVEQQRDNSGKWHLDYSDEYSKTNYEVKIIEKSLDTRVAGTLYSRNKLKVFDWDFHKSSHDDPSIKREYESFINGPEVDRKLCSEHLQQMTLF